VVSEAFQSAVIRAVICCNLGRLLRELARLPGSDESADQAVMTAVLLLGGEVN
jgi:hypothetical protein